MSALWRLLFALTVLLSAPLTAQTFPALTGRVVDGANLLDPSAEAALDAKLQGYEAQTGRQMVVATLPDLQGYPIEDYGYRLGRHWAIGDEQRDDGTLLIVAPAERKVRIESGYGVEAIMTDAFASTIINTQMLPRFKAGDYPGGIAAGADAMIAQLQLTPEEAAKRAKAAAAQSRSADSNGAAVFWIFVILFFLVPMILPLIFGRKRGRRMSSGPIIIWGPGDWGSGGGGSGWGGGGSSWGGGGGGFSGGGGGFGGGGASGDW